MQSSFSSQLNAFRASLQELFNEQNNRLAQFSNHNSRMIHELARHVGNFPLNSSTSNSLSNQSSTTPTRSAVSNTGFQGTPSMILINATSSPVQLAVPAPLVTQNNQPQILELSAGVRYDIKSTFHSATEVYNAFHGLGQFSFGNKGCYNGGYLKLEEDTKRSWRKGWSVGKQKHYSRCLNVVKCVEAISVSKNIDITAALVIMDATWKQMRNLGNVDKFLIDEKKAGRIVLKTR